MPDFVIVIIDVIFCNAMLCEIDIRSESSVPHFPLFQSVAELSDAKQILLVRAAFSGIRYVSWETRPSLQCVCKETQENKKTKSLLKWLN